MMSLRKTMEKFGPPQTRQIIYHSKGTDKSYPKMYFLLNLSHCVKSYGHFCQILVLFTMTAHQIWSCHVTQDANFEIFLFCPNSKLNIWKRQKISSGKALYFRSYQPETSQGVENTPPVLLGLTLFAIILFFTPDMLSSLFSITKSTNI